MAGTDYANKLARGDLSWWFVYGPGRSGTSYVSRMIARGAGRLVSDWGLGGVLNPLERMPNLLDKDRYRRDLALNILETARQGHGKQIDLVYKQALAQPSEYAELCRMFGPAERRIFCLRAPSGYIASAVKKFDHLEQADLQRRYMATFGVYEKIGGDIVEYSDRLSLDLMREFLAPLDLGADVEEFAFKGQEAPDMVPAEMQTAYDAFRAAHFPSQDRQYVRSA